MKIDITHEIEFTTARSGGSGGQNVNKVESMVIGKWLLNASTVVLPQQKEELQQRLANRLTADGYLLVKSQTQRSQLANKKLVIQKMHQMIHTALIPKKSRIATAPTQAANNNRIASKKRKAELKQNRKKPLFNTSYD